MSRPYGEPLHKCRARMRMASVSPPSRVSKAVLGWLVVLFLGAVFTATRFGIRSAEEWECFLTFLAFLLIPILALIFGIIRPSELGELKLHEDCLVFKHSMNNRVVDVSLADIDRIGRKRRVLHVAKTNKRDTIYFTCPRLSGEDFYDRIIERIDELGLEVVHHERRR